MTASSQQIFVMVIHLPCGFETVHFCDFPREHNAHNDIINPAGKCNNTSKENCLTCPLNRYLTSGRYLAPSQSVTQQGYTSAAPLQEITNYLETPTDYLQPQAACNKSKRTGKLNMLAKGE